ncbi:hypothetical protein VFPPC_16496 [Pochonia chlamydosporia 170]|uniref:Uncharacterized protein n=1 Tax=Pochonia chlamydosporia 170 TaxID=1380566 RepID=A0A179FEE8_METCM|nr:hypothetical protein VFPPC_16496 [Pochonia chlamydosporia 170]OAQ63621.1 hypothetical protein VFPPC_16496 [Pochonia chlamydosporia 170]
MDAVTGGAPHTQLARSQAWKFNASFAPRRPVVIQDAAESFPYNITASLRRRVYLATDLAMSRRRNSHPSFPLLSSSSAIHVHEFFTEYLTWPFIEV